MSEKKQVVDKTLQRLAVRILDAIAMGADEQTVCDSLGVKRATFLQWVIKYPEFEKAVIEAKRMRADHYRSEIQRRMYDVDGSMKVLHKDEVPGEKLIFEKLKWLAETDNPEKYGTRVKHEGNLTMPVQIVVDTGIDQKEEDVIEVEEVIDPTDLL